MSRSVDRWVGKDDDAVPPPRVRLRVFERFDGRCYLCERKISASEYWECDHVKAIINGGENNEANLAPACSNCCKPKTARDVAEKSSVAKTRKKHLGITKPKRQWSPDPKKWRKIGFGQYERRKET
jgi:5-methylcytosine-specific restriction endonuclease McrA